jgi:dihydrofolate reductase
MSIKYTAVVATDREGAIGLDGSIPWRAKEDMKRFKLITLGHPVIMGHVTACSLPFALPGRLNIVLSRKHDVPYEGMVIARSKEEAMVLAEAHLKNNERCWEHNEVCVIGGERIYRMFLNDYTGLHLTTLQTTIPKADTFFPVEAFMDAYGRTRRLRLLSGGNRVIKDGTFKTTYAHYAIVPPSEATGVDLAYTQNHLPWSKAVEAEDA